MADVTVQLTNQPIQVSVSTPGPPGPIGPAGSSSLTNSITGISISGGVGLTGNLNILAGSNITLSQAGNSLTITATSTSTDISGLATSGYVNTTSGSINERINLLNLTYLTTGSSGAFYASNSEQRIKTEIPSGSGQLFINYNSNFSSIPLIYCQIQTSGDVNYYINTSGIQINGYTAVFSDIIRETGCWVHTLAKIL